jgi:hypothetical protein
MKPPVVYSVLGLVITALLFFNLSTMSSLHDSRLHSSIVEGQLRKEAAETVKSQAQDFVRGVQAVASGSFQSIINDAKLFLKLSRESEANINQLIEKRKSFTQLMLQDTEQNFEKALNVIRIDDEIIAAHEDYAALQASHRGKFLQKLEPLAKQLGLD